MRGPAVARRERDLERVDLVPHLVSTVFLSNLQERLQASVGGSVSWCRHQVGY